MSQRRKIRQPHRPASVPHLTQPGRMTARELRAERALMDQAVMSSAPYPVDLLQVALLGVMDDQDVADRACAALDGLTASHPVPGDLRPVIYAKLTAAIIVDLYCTGYDQDGNPAGTPDAMLTAELDRLGRALRAGLGHRLSLAGVA